MPVQLDLVLTQQLLPRTHHNPQWIEEVRQICGPQIPVLLVGCKRDLREQAIAKGKPVAGNFVEKAQVSGCMQAMHDGVFEKITRASHADICSPLVSLPPRPHRARRWPSKLGPGPTTNARLFVTRALM